MCAPVYRGSLRKGVKERWFYSVVLTTAEESKEGGGVSLYLIDRVQEAFKICEWFRFSKGGLETIKLISRSSFAFGSLSREE